jgi:hypothetical protein
VHDASWALVIGVLRKICRNMSFSRVTAPGAVQALHLFI